MSDREDDRSHYSETPNGPTSPLSVNAPESQGSDACCTWAKCSSPFRAVCGLIAEYCDNSSIHGVKYIGGRNRFCFERLWWLVVFLLSMCGCAWLCFTLYIKWNTNPVIISFSDKMTPIFSVPFPAVTICPEIKARQDLFNLSRTIEKLQNAPRGALYGDILNNEELPKMEALSQVCDPHLLDEIEIRRVWTTTENDIVRELTAMAPKEIFFHCKWRNVNESCGNLFRPVITEEGICYSFNQLEDVYSSDWFQPVPPNLTERLIKAQGPKKKKKPEEKTAKWSLFEGYKFQEYKDIEEAYPRAALGLGPQSGLSVLLRSRDADYDPLCRGAVNGFKIFLHAPGEVPQMSKRFIRAELQQEVIVTIKPKMIKSQGLDMYTTKQRGCYLLSDKRKLKYFKGDITEPNCLLECLTDYILKECGCVKFSMPRHKNYTQVCGSAKLQCILEKEEQLMNLKIRERFYKNETCVCLPTCTSLKYDYETLQVDVDWMKVLSPIQKNWTVVYNGSQFARVVFAFNEEEFTSLKRSELYNYVDFMSNFGGLLGLFMGISLLSVAEIFYFVTIRLVYKCKTEWKRAKEWHKRRKSMRKSMRKGKQVGFEGEQG